MTGSGWYDIGLLPDTGTVSCGTIWTAFLRIHQYGILLTGAECGSATPTHTMGTEVHQQLLTLAGDHRGLPVATSHDGLGSNTARSYSGQCAAATNLGSDWELW